MRYDTRHLTSIENWPHLRPGFLPVAGLRILDHTPVYWFAELLDDNGRLEIGRTKSRDIRLDDLSVSCHHAEILRVDRGLYFLRDLGSRNGVKVRERGHYGVWERAGENGRDEKVILQPGIHIKLGNVVIVPVGPDGKCPITVRDHKELARHAAEVYGSAAAATEVVGRSRHWITRMVQSVGRMFSL